jgi:hypothetical protein
MAPLNETLWQAWLAKGNARDNRRRTDLNAAVRFVLVAVLLVVAGVWSNLTGYDVVVRFTVAAGALFIMSQALRSADYVVAGVFGALALLYNPIAPVFTFTGEWPRVFVTGSAFLLMSSAYWPSRQVRHA